MIPPFQSATALVTGAASGIGAATARALRRQGAERLVLVDRDDAALARIADELDMDDALIPAVQDVIDADAWNRLEGAISERFGGVDHLVAAAGIGHAMVPIADLPVDQWRRTMAVNLDGTFLALQAAIRLIRAGGRNGGSIVLLSSSTAFRAQPALSGYAVSKAGIAQLARTAAAELARENIRVNAIAPGVVETPLFRGLPWFDKLVEDAGSEEAAFRNYARKAVPLGRATTADETAAQILFLLGRSDSTITGTIFNADGGVTLNTG